jgi:hypothetical protein
MRQGELNPSWRIPNKETLTVIGPRMGGDILQHLLEGSPGAGASVGRGR